MSAWLLIDWLMLGACVIGLGSMIFIIVMTWLPRIRTRTPLKMVHFIGYHATVHVGPLKLSHIDLPGHAQFQFAGKAYNIRFRGKAQRGDEVHLVSWDEAEQLFHARKVGP